MTARHKEISAICMRLLSRREHSRFELNTRLSRQGFAAGEVDQVLDGLAANGWQSDQRFAQDYSRARMRKGHGPLRIRYELRERGIEHAPVDVFIQDLYGGWDELIEQVHRKKYRNTTPDTYQERAKRWRYLQRRGFTPEQIQTLFARIKPGH